MSAPFLFLDTEFVPRPEPLLLSLALTDGQGWHVYGALDASGPRLRNALARANRVVRTEVLPQLALAGPVHVGLPQLGRALSQALEASGVAAWQVAYDFHTDFDLLEQALRAADRWAGEAGWSRRLEPVHVGYLLGEPSAHDAMHDSWAASEKEGLRRHHALSDARALAAAFRAVHGG